MKLDLRHELLSLGEAKLTPDELYSEMVKIHLRNLNILPIEFKTEDLYTLAQVSGWLKLNNGFWEIT